MSKIDYQALREAAEKATKGSYIVGHTSVNKHGNLTGVFVCQKWKGEPGGVIAECHVNCLVETDAQAYANAEFIAAFNPKIALALLDERERNQQYIKRRDQENEEIALTVGKLRVELEAAENNLIDSECHVAELEEALRDKQALLEASEKRIAELEARAFNPAILDVIAERQRQQSVEGWMPEHDDEHCNGELAMAAVCYINETGTVNRNGGKPWGWPWDASWWKPNARRRNLVKAGALILAEIERIDRAAGIGKGGVMLQHQMQPTFNTCMATCVAMVAGQPVDEVVERWHQKFHDKTDWLDDALDYYKIPYFYGSQRKAELLYGFIYFLTVPSLNIKGGLHQILMSLTAERGIEVFDPAMGRPGSKYYVWGEAQNDDQFGVISWCVDLSVPVVQQKGED